MNNENQKKYQIFQLEEARWIDGEVRKFIPKWMQWVVEKNGRNFLGRMGHFLVDFVWIGTLQRIKIKRSQDTVILGGKGFRQGMDHGYKIASIRTKVQRRGKEIAEKKFNVDITFKK